MSDFEFDDEDESPDEDALFEQQMFLHLNMEGIEVEGNMIMIDDLLDFENMFLSDDDDFGFTDSDSEYSDDENTDKICHMLEDSKSVLSKIFYTPKPWVSTKTCYPQGTGTYESIFKVFDEVDILLRAWRRRTNHPFTAHLKNEPERFSYPPAEEYSSFFDSDQERNLSPGECREALTKQKYCQSTRVFKSLFNTEADFQNLYKKMRLLRKYTFEIAFSLFLEAFPPEVRDRLPSELWEKIWWNTQTPFGYPHQFKAGLRSTDGKYLKVEQDRVNKFFGAVGNLQIVLMDILFSKGKIIEPSVYLTLRASAFKLDLKRLYTRNLFQDILSYIDSTFSRLAALDTLPAMTSIPRLAKMADEILENSDETDLVQKLKSGNWNLEHAKMDPVSLKKSRIFVSEGMNMLLPISTNEDPAIIKVFDINSKQCVYNCYMSVSDALPLHFIDDGFALSLSEKNLAFIVEGNSISKTECKVLVWNFPEHLKKDQVRGGISPIELTSPEVHVLDVEPVLDFQSRCSQIHHTTLKENANAVFIYRQAEKNRGILYNLDTKKEIWSVEFPEIVTRVWIRGSFALLSFSTNIQLWNFDIGKPVGTFKFQDMCQMNNDLCSHREPERECDYFCKFDSNPERSQFVIFSSYLTFYQVLEFDPCSADGSCKVLFHGTTFASNFKSLKDMDVVLTDSVLFHMDLSNPVVEKNQIGENGQILSTLTAYDLRKSSPNKYRIVSFLDHFFWFQSILTEPIFDLNFYTRNCRMISSSDTKLYIMNESGNCIIVDLSLSAQEIVEAEACRFKRIELEEEEKVQEAKREKEALLAKKFEALQDLEKSLKDQKLFGTLTNWKGSYGFINPSKANKSVGKVFVHISKIENRSEIFIKPNSKIEFKLELDPERRTFRATWARCKGPMIRSWKNKSKNLAPPNTKN